MSENKDRIQKLLDLLLEAIKRDNELRQEYQIGEKFRFIRDRLNALKSQLEQSINEQQQIKEKIIDQVSADEAIVYVYLFNSQGMIIKTWQTMLNPGVFYEYSVNRPIYAERAQIESFLRSKTNKLQNGYIAVIVKKSDILTPVEQTKDAIGTPLIKVKEGALKVHKLLYLFINNHEYIIDPESSELTIKKPSG